MFKSVFITTQTNIILILICKLLFEVTKHGRFAFTMAIRTNIFGFIRVKTMANFRKGTWNKLFDVSLVVKLLPTLKHPTFTLLTSTAKKKNHRTMN